LFQIKQNFKRNSTYTGKKQSVVSSIQPVVFSSVILAILKLKDLVLKNFNLFIQGQKTSVHALKSVVNALEIGHTKIMEISLIFSKPSSLFTMYLSKEDIKGISSP